MNSGCRSFRRALESRLAGRAERPELSGLPGFDGLEWHEHLLGCTDCRALLESEEALEALLATLPEPQLPAELAQRVVARLESARAEESTDEVALDALLDLAATEDVPGDLAGDVLARLAPERGEKREHQRLERLLDLVPAAKAPEGLVDRTLAALEPHRTRARPRRLAPLPDRPVAATVRPRSSGPLSANFMRVAAAVLVAVGGAVALRVVLGPSSSGTELVRSDEPVPAKVPDSVAVAPEPAPEPSTPSAPEPRGPGLAAADPEPPPIAGTKDATIADAGTDSGPSIPPDSEPGPGSDAQGDLVARNDTDPDAVSPTREGSAGSAREREGADPSAPAVAPIQTVEVPSTELLASLDLLENWELLTDSDLDLLLSSLDTVDEVLLDFDQDAETEEG